MHPDDHEREMTPEKHDERSMAGSPVRATQELDSPIHKEEEDKHQEVAPVHKAEEVH